MAVIRFKRGTASDLATAVAADQLLAGEPYLITDDQKVSVGLGVDTYIDLAKMAAGGVVAGLRSLTFFSEVPENSTIVLVSSARFAFTINQMFNLKTSAGTITAALQINGTPVTGLTALSVTSTPQSPSASAANVVSIGDRLTLVLTSNSSAADLEFTAEVTV
jgi:hypothetical protein